MDKVFIFIAVLGFFALLLWGSEWLYSRPGR